MAPSLIKSTRSNDSNEVSLMQAQRCLRVKGDNMGQSAERREELREACQSRLFVQVTSCPETDLIGATFSCHTEDVSAGGLRISSDAQVPAGAKLDLWVENSNRRGKYFLTSDVRWVAPNESGRCEMGLALMESPTTDIELWRRDHH